MSKREELQRAGLNKWARAGFRGILQWATGVGKTYAAILAIEHVISTKKDSKILIVCPTLDIISNFKREFIKFKRRKLLDNCQFICYASINKTNDHFDLVILDEIHHVTSPKRIKFLSAGNYTKLLGLSASLTSCQLYQLTPFAPVVDVLSLKGVLDEGFVSKFTVINYGITLTDEERETYDTLTKKIDYSREKYATSAWKQIGLRARLLYSASQKISILKAITELFPKEYGIVFSLTKEDAETIADLLGETCEAIHSGHSSKKREAKLKSIRDGRTKTRLISTPKIFDEGVSIPRLTYGLLVARHSKERQFIQSLGRLIRAETVDKHAILIRLFVIDSIEENWVKTSQMGFTSLNTNSFDGLKNIILTIREKG